MRAQSRIATASGIFLDIAAVDYLGNTLQRRAGEADAAYSARIRGNLLNSRATREGLVRILTNLTGRKPIVFEPLNAADTGGYNVNAGYNTSGGYGSFSLPFQFLLTAYRPDSTSDSQGGGYNIGPGSYNSPPMFYADTEQFSGTVSDAEIYAAVAAVLPTSSIAWTQLSN